ncbi:hypothetical protein ER308_16815 [Egibacter rhizosphaerae]|uniref:Copper-containing nitrite reductase n=1 Tax=Egibacter rhizosphaerae TaxID=1670831 RepID=A0A411YIL0_9ACTN|nr:multicopper oxidase domain-containing protein [Egibacter rhizosphaerae]QBI21070.1 hypothetical protein ER308_16815 [Egibacter rhizosphaerae]
MREVSSKDRMWLRGVGIGLPLAIGLLLLATATLVGTIMTASEVRDDTERLLGAAEESEGEAAELTEPDDAAAPAAGGGTAPEERPQVEVHLELGELYIEADVDEVPAWAEVTFTAENVGAAAHDAVIDGDGTAMLEPGETDTFVYEADGSGVIELICTVPGHAEGGMALEIPIAGDEGDAEHAEEVEAETVAADGAAAPQAASPDNVDDYDGDKPPLERRDPEAPPSPDGDHHEVVWDMTEEVAQIAPDVYQEVWTFDGQVPGPTLRAKVGDTIDVTIRNPEDAQVPHSIDFHASQTAWDHQMVDVEPGEELTYSFEATHAGVFMYHCGTDPTLHHIGAGMYGTVIVEPADGLDDVDHEFMFVQSEFYLGEQGEVGDLTRMSEGAANPDLVVFNGVADQYLEEPIEIGVDDEIRVWINNVGPSADSSFHVVGTIFDKVVEEGVTLERDNAGQWGSQAIDLAPSQGGYVEFSLAEDGLYPIVTHAFNHVGRGALGLFAAGDVELDGDVSH